VERSMTKLHADEKKLLESVVERGEWKSARLGARERDRYARYAKATFHKNRQVKASRRPRKCDALPLFRRRFANCLAYRADRQEHGCRRRACV